MKQNIASDIIKRAQALHRAYPDELILSASDTLLESIKQHASSLAETEHFYTWTRCMLDELDALEKDLPHALEEETAEQEDAEEWARRVAPRVQTLLEQEDLHPGDREHLQMLGELTEEYALHASNDGISKEARIGVRMTDGTERKRIEEFLDALESGKLTRVRHIAEGAEETTDTPEEFMASLESFVRNAPAILDEEVCGALGLKQEYVMRVYEQCKEIVRKITQEKDGKGMETYAEEWRLALHMKKELEEFLANMRDVEQAMQAIDTREVSDDECFEITKKRNVFGCFLRKGMIRTLYLNRDKLNALPPEKREKKRRELELHERNHAVLDLITERIQPDLYEQVRETIAKEGRENEWNAGLEAVRALWQIDCPSNTEGAKKKDADKLTEELLVRFSTRYLRDRNEWTPEERRLFALLDPKWEERTPTTIAIPDEENAVISLMSDGGGAGDGGTEEEDTGVMLKSVADVTSYDFADQVQRNIDIIEREAGNIETFAEAYQKQLGGQHAKVLEYAAYLRKSSGEVHTTLKSKMELTEEEARKSALEALAKGMATFMKKIEDVKKSIGSFKTELLDTANAPKEGGRGSLWRSMNIKWITVYDIYMMGNDAWEDIKRMWERRSQLVRAEVGESLTSWIPDNIKYVGRLKHEFNRRREQSELDEVGVWKKAFENIDSHALQKMLGSVNNTDELKAILILLTERGRLDWNDHGLWRTLSRLSRYEMPIEACDANDLLRDAWLRKTTTDIWGDKDNYFNWRQSNDSNFESGKKKFTATADQLSNIDGALKNELKKQLSMYKRAKREGTAISEDVNPHLYEEVIWYAIRNGKMTMEDKFFYLIQGVRHGLLSIDRLRVLAGEGGGILNSFPFIDYFYGKNNSLAELKDLGRRLEESGDPDEPGEKTTMFLWLEVAREESVKQRLSKGMQRNAEEMDHEDIPYFAPQLGYNEISNLFDVISGARQKVTFEGAKNAYVGFNTKFQAFSALAEFDHEKLDWFSREDYQDMARTLTSFVHMDNILRGFGRKSTHQNLSEQQYDSIPVMSKNRTVREYRDELNKFVAKTVENLPFDKDGFEAEANVTLKEYLDYMRDESTRSAILGDEKKIKAIVGASGKFQVYLEKAIMSDRERFLDMLRGSTWIPAACSNTDKAKAVAVQRERLAAQGQQQTFATAA